MLKLCSICHQRLSVLQNYFDGATKSVSDLCLIKFLDILAKQDFPVRTFFLMIIWRTSTKNWKKFQTGSERWLVLETMHYFLSVIREITSLGH